MQKLEDCLNIKSENLNFIKFIAAIFVIYSHSFSICLGVNKDWLELISKGELSFGGLAVAIFLFASGLYVTKSLIEKNDRKQYVIVRFVRIFPLLIFVIFMTVFIMGPIVTTVSIKEYFFSLQTYRYLLYTILIPSYELPGVFVNNPLVLVNGSLWTLVLECLCYIGLYISSYFNLLNQKFMKRIFILLIIMFILIFICKIDILYSYCGYIRPLFMFLEGSMFYIFKNKIIIKKNIGIIAIAGLVVMAAIGWINAGIILCLPYIICIISYSEIQCGKFLSNLGNYSYAMYLIAFPIQQIVYRYGIGTLPLTNTIISVVIDIIFAIILYYIIEKPSMKIVKIFKGNRDKFG